MTNGKEGFCGEFEFLSNFSPSPVEYKGHTYPSVLRMNILWVI